MGAIAGLRGTDDWGTDERPTNFLEFIMWRNPHGTPLLALTSKVGKKAVNDAKYSWWDEPVDIVRLQIDGALVTAATTIVVDSTDPTAAAGTLNYGEATHLKPGDLLMVEKATEPATIDNELLVVTSVTSATTFVAARGAAGTTAGSIADDAFLTLVGSAFEQGSDAPNAASRNPIQYYNHLQIHKDIYKASKSAAGTFARTGDILANDRRRKSFDHARGIEMSWIWGRRFQDTGPTGEPRYFSGGLREFIPASNTTIFSTTPTQDTFFDAVTPSLEFASEAGDERIVIGGQGALNSLNKMVRNSGTINHEGIVKLHGMRMETYVLPSGTLAFRKHPMLSRHPRFTYSMFIIDPTALEYMYMAGRDTDFTDEIQTKKEDVHMGQWLSEVGLRFKHGGLTMGYLGNFVV